MLMSHAFADMQAGKHGCRRSRMILFKWIIIFFEIFLFFSYKLTNLAIFCDWVLLINKSTMTFDINFTYNHHWQWSLDQVALTLSVSSSEPASNKAEFAKESGRVGKGGGVRVAGSVYLCTATPQLQVCETESGIHIILPDHNAAVGGDHFVRK